MNRIDRLSAILNMLQSSSSVRVMQLASRFGLSKRTIYRDLKALEEAGIPLSGDGLEGYSLVDGYKLPPLMFSHAEALSFLAAQQLVKQYTDTSISRNYDLGIDKIKAVMLAGDKKDMTGLNSIIASHDFAHVPSSDGFLNAIIDYIITKKRIQISYFSYHSQQSSIREIDPIGVFFSLSNWYLIAYCHLKCDYRTFHVKRINSIVPTAIKIEKQYPTLYSFIEKMGSQQKLKKVVLRVKKECVTVIGESRYYQGLVEEKIVGESVELHFMTFSTERFARWYMSYLDIATIIEPIEMKTIVKDIIQKYQ